MEGKPKRNQILVPVPMKQEFIDLINDSFSKLGYSNRSDFIRDAIVEKIKAELGKFDESIAAAPSRVGKGGKPTHKKKTTYVIRSHKTHLNEK